MLGSDVTSLKLGIVFGLIMVMVGSGMAASMAVEIYSDRQKLLGRAGVALIVGLGLTYFGFRIANREYGFLTDFTFVEGQTLGKQRCGKNMGVQFEYAYDGQRYTGCTSFGGADQVKINGGRYLVRVWKGDPAGGRMDLERPVGH